MIHGGLFGNLGHVTLSRLYSCHFVCPYCHELYNHGTQGISHRNLGSPVRTAMLKTTPTLEVATFLPRPINCNSNISYPFAIILLNVTWPFSSNFCYEPLRCIFNLSFCIFNSNFFYLNQMVIVGLLVTGGREILPSTNIRKSCPTKLIWRDDWPSIDFKGSSAFTTQKLACV